jgi:hypothetical protein
MNSKEDGPIGNGQADLLSLDEFLQWIRNTLELADSPSPQSSLSALTDRDQLLNHRLIMCFDELTATIAQPTGDINAVVTVRDLYLYYLFVTNRPTT